MKPLPNLKNKLKQYPWTVYTGMVGAGLAVIGGILLTVSKPTPVPHVPVEQKQITIEQAPNEEALLPTKKYFYKRALLKAKVNAEDPQTAVLNEMDTLMNQYPQDAVVIQKIATYLNDQGLSETYQPTEPDLLMQEYDKNHEFLDVNSALSQFYHGDLLPLDVKHVKLNDSDVALQFDESWIYGNPENITYLVNGWYTNGQTSIIFLSVGGKRAVVVSDEPLKDGQLTIRVLHDPILSKFEQ